MIAHHAPSGQTIRIAGGPVLSGDLILDGATLWRWAAKCMTVALLCAAMGLWAFPVEDSAEMLIKLGASIAFLGGAGLFLLISRPGPPPRQLELDLRRDEIRVVERDPSGALYLQERHSLAHLGDISLEEDRFCAWDLNGALVLDVAVAPAEEQG